MKVLRPSVIVLLVGALLVLAPGTAHATPAVAEIDPGGAANTSNAQVTIRGSGFLPGARVALVERVSPQGPDEASASALNHGTVALDGTTISGVVLPTLGQAPSRSEQDPRLDVTWYVTVTNPDGKVSARAFTVAGDPPALHSAEPRLLPRGATTRVTITGDNLARRASFKVENPTRPHNPPPSDGEFEITLSNVTWKDLRTYTIDVKVPKEYAAGDEPGAKTADVERFLQVTNTDGQGDKVAGFLKVAGSPAKVPTVTKINKTVGSNSDANREFAVAISGGNFNGPDDIAARLVGHCPATAPDCAMNGRAIGLVVKGMTDGTTNDPRVTPDVLSGTFDLAMAAPGRYSVEVTNLGTPNGVGRLENAFEIVANPPRITPPSTPIELKAGVTRTFDIDGSDFARGDTVAIADTNVVIESITRTRITVRATPSSKVTTGPRDLVVRHTTGVGATCTTCVRTVAAPVQKTPTEKYIDAVHRLFLQRPPSPTEVSRWRGSVDRGNRLALTRELATSETFAGTQIDLLYRSILGRPSDPSGRSYWLQQIRRGTRLDQIASYFFGSAEFFKQSGSTNRGFVDRLYVQILGRRADEGGRRYWVDQLESGRLDRAGVASWFYAGVESRRQRAHRQYVLVFGKAPTEAVRDKLADRIGAAGDLVVAAELAAGREYYDKVTKT